MADVMRGGWENWQWDETLFAGAAAYYVRGRVPYAPGLADTLSATLARDGRGRLLDLGCGPGVVALSLAHLFDAVVGLDPDSGMLAEAARIADQRSIRNVTWVCLRAEDLPAELGSFRVVTLAASFHWMDRPRVAATLRSMLGAGGAAVQVDAPAYRPPDGTARGELGSGLQHPSPPTDAIEELVRRYLGPDRRAGRGIRNTSPDGEDAVFQGAGFAPAETVIVPDGRELVRTVDDVVATVFSSSSSTPHLFGERTPAFEQELRGLLALASGSGRFSVKLADNVLRVWR